MATPTRSKRKPARRGSIKRVSKKAVQKGINVKDLVGTIKLTVDPVEFQRRIRDEWD